MTLSAQSLVKTSDVTLLSPSVSFFVPRCARFEHGIRNGLKKSLWHPECDKRLSRVSLSLSVAERLGLCNPVCPQGRLTFEQDIDSRFIVRFESWCFRHVFSRATIWLISAVTACVFYLSPLSLFVCLSVFYSWRKNWLVPFAIRVTASRGWTMWSGERSKDSGKPDGESTMRVCAFFQKMDPEEHCLKLVTGGKTFRRLGISWHATVKGWPEESRNPQHVYQELPADIFMFHTHYDLFSVPSFILCLC